MAFSKTDTFCKHMTGWNVYSMCNLIVRSIESDKAATWRWNQLHELENLDVDVAFSKYAMNNNTVSGVDQMQNFNPVYQFITT